LFLARVLPSLRLGAPAAALSRHAPMRLPVAWPRGAARFGAFTQPFQLALGANFDLARLQERRRTPAILSRSTRVGQSLLPLRARREGRWNFFRAGLV
jgi:hypothetical protein